MDLDHSLNHLVKHILHDYNRITFTDLLFRSVLGSFCGHSNPPDFLSSSGSLYIRFVTDSVNSSSGFSVDLSMISSPCGRSIYTLTNSTSRFEIESPMNGAKYQPNMNCLWEIKAEDDQLIDIKFTRFDLEEDENNKCTNDYVEIGDEEVNSKKISSSFLTKIYNEFPWLL